MLHHENTPDEQQPPSAVVAAERRVTPEELAAALARLEVRKEVGQRHLEGTLPLGEAVQQLGLDATPEELWQEVQAGRTQPQTASRQSSSGRALRLSGVAAATMLLLTGLFTFRLTSHTPAPTVTTVSAPAAPQPAPITIPADLLVRQSDGKMVLLSEIGDNQPVLCALTATDKGASFASFAPGPLHWTLIKHGGQVYLRGWIADMSDTALRSSQVEIHSDRVYVTSGLRPVPVTLPVNGFQSTPGLTNDDMISGQKFTPDRHFREKW